MPPGFVVWAGVGFAIGIPGASVNCEVSLAAQECKVLKDPLAASSRGIFAFFFPRATCCIARAEGFGSSLQNRALLNPLLGHWGGRCCLQSFASVGVLKSDSWEMRLYRIRRDGMEAVFL